MTQETLEQTFHVPSPACLNLGNIRGSVEVQVGEDGLISVRAIKHVGSGSAKRTEIIMQQEEDGTVTVKTRNGNGSWGLFGLSQPCKVDYRVQVPRSCRLKISGVSNTASIQGVEGEIEVSSVSGPLTLENLTGPVFVHTVSGDISGTRLSGSLKLEAVSGSVQLSESSLLSAEGSTVSGNISLETSLGEGPYRFSSVSASVTLDVPDETRCTLKLNSLSGRCKSSLPVSSSQRHNGAQVLEVNGGGVLVSLSSTSGNLWLEAPMSELSKPVQPSQVVKPPEPPQPVAQPLSTAEILERIERGEMTVEEGLKALKGE